jgi:3-oxoacyl-[acyl-carrier protein] reductase
MKTKVALVTGASRGIGRTIALKLASDGYGVVVNYASDAEKADEVVAEIKRQQGRAISVRADVSCATDVKQLFDSTLKEFGRLDVVVNNAGVILYKPVAQTSEEEFDRVMDINVKGTFLVCREAANRMNEGGRIINFSSSTTAMMLPTYATYCASKGAVEQLTHVLAKELGPKGISVNCVSPGPTETELFFTGKTPEMVQRLTAMSAFNRLGKPEDIAGVVAFLAGPDSGWITGQTIRANGGTI